MQFQLSLYRKIILTSLLLILLSVWFVGGFSPRPSQAVSTNASLRAWGYNADGELGNNSNSNSNIPVEVNLPGEVSATSIMAGFYHSLAIGSDSKLYTWGNNLYGQLGNGSNTSSSVPVTVSLSDGVTPTVIAAGDFHSLAIGSDNKLYAWGQNNFGQLGNGSTTNSNTPTVVNLPDGIIPTAIAGGLFHSLAIGSDNKLYAWGSNQAGQLGNGSNNNSAIPVVVSLPDGVVPIAIAAGAQHSLAIGSDNKLYAWGYNAYGQLGNGTTTGSNIPVLVNLAEGVIPIAIAAGYYHTMATGNDGKLYSWGDNSYGQLGDGTSTSRSTPVVINLPGSVTSTAISGGGRHSMAIGGDSKVYAWGDNTYGQLGDGTTITQSIMPVQVNLPAGAMIAAGGYHNLAIPALPKLSINNISHAEGNTGTTSFTFTVTLSYTATQTVTVAYATSDGTATAPSDYTSTSGTLTFSPGITTQTVPVVVKGDTTFEADETFTVTLSSPTNATLSNSSAVGTILNDDPYQPFMVTIPTDDGTGKVYGTLSYALSQPITGTTPVTITFALTQGNTISFTSSLTTTAKVKAGITIYGGAFGSTSHIILNGNRVAGDGLHLGGNNYLVNLTIEHFGGRELVLEGTGNRMQGVVVIAS